MIIYGKPIKQKTLKKTIIIILILLLSVILLSCTKKLDPTTSILKHVFMKKK
jgi:hypothetical protein